LYKVTTHRVLQRLSPAAFVVAIALLYAVLSPSRSAVAGAPAVSSPANSGRAASASLLQGAELLAGDQGLVLALQLSRAVSPRLSRLARPERVVLDLPGTQRSPGWQLPRAEGLVRDLRGARQGHGYRLVLELGPGHVGAPHWQQEPAGQGSRLRLIVGTLPAATLPTIAAAQASPKAPEATPRAAPRGNRDIVVVIDAGHGGEDPGASGPGGTHEKDVVLAIARALVGRLNAQPGMQALLTRDSDRFIELTDRMGRARTAHADLFISVHADAVPNHEIAGASVYTLSWRGASSEAARFLADRENAAVLKGGVELNGNPELNALLLDVAQSANMGASVEAANEVLGALDRVGAVRKREVQHAAFVVLKSPDVPSMLVESAYISNPAEERKLRSEGWQQQLAAAIEAGVVAYFRQHPPDGSHYAAQRRPAQPL
jgi:N-acetylmuramoyl-L-alanine amidase